MSAAPDGIYGSGPIGSQGPCVLLRPNERSPHCSFALSRIRRFAPNAGPRWGWETASGSRILSLVAR
jgi:hypothetical protein